VGRTGNVIIMQGKATSHGECLRTDADGDTFIGTFVDEPGKPGAWTFLGGTGKWKGVTGGGTTSTSARASRGLTERRGLHHPQRELHAAVST